MSTSFFGSKVEGADQRENAPPPQLRGAGYRLRQALDSVGAFVGPLLAVAFMVWFANDIRAVMWVAVVPAFITVALPILYVHKHAHVGTAAQARLPWPRPSGCRGVTSSSCCWARCPPWPASAKPFWCCVRKTSDSRSATCPLMLIVMNVFYAALAYPAGAAADRVSRRTLLIIGLALLIAADLVLAAAASPLLAFVGAALWGLHMAFTQGSPALQTFPEN